MRNGWHLINRFISGRDAGINMEQMTEVEFFGVYNLRCVKKCCRNCKHIREKYSSGVGQIYKYYYCGHPEIQQVEYPSPISEFTICDAFEIANSEH